MKVRINYLFSRNQKVGSKIISWAGSKLVNLDKNPSHVALLIKDKWVFESTLDSGIRIIGYKEWSNINEELAKIDGGERDFSEIKDLYKKLEGCKYDWSGIIYYAIRFSIKYLLNIRIPKTNIFDSKGKYFCCEVIGKLNNKNYSMSHPAEIYVELKETLPNSSVGLA